MEIVENILNQIDIDFGKASQSKSHAIQLMLSDVIL